MREQILTIIDTNGKLSEISLGQYQKQKLVLGRDESICDVVMTDAIVSKIQGTMLLENGRLMYQDEDSRNGTFLGLGSGRRLLAKQDGMVEVYDKDILCIGNLRQSRNRVLLLYSVSEKREVWKWKPLSREVITIGRDSSNDICLPGPGISRVHCRIGRIQGACVLEDSGSVNGVLVNGERVTGRIKLQDKDVIQILGFQLLFCQNGIYYKTAPEGISLQVRDVTKEVGKGSKKKRILNHVSCEIEGNEFVAIIGGSGAGKTTLMNAISGFEPDFEGKVYCNGTDLVEHFQMLKNMIGFVPQQDIIYENLTLKKMLYYAAKIRMPKDTRASEIEKRILEVLQMVDLVGHQTTYIRKLSGGQKKRASIAVELLADPKLFFLDEPTSGLDPGTEKNLMISLKKLARQQNKTIIMVTHTTANLHLCDKIIFMGPGGRLCFCGNVEEAKAFYQTDDLVNIYNMIADDPEACERKYRNARQREKNSGTAGERKPIPVKRSKNARFHQFLVLAQRYGELMFHDTQRLLVLLLQPCLIAALLYVVADKDIFKIYESTKSMLFALSCSGIWIGLFNSIQEICKERTIVKREYMANLRLPGYVMSKFVFQFALGGIQAAALTMIFLGLIGKKRAGIFFNNFTMEMFLTVWLTVLAAIALGFVLSAMVRSGDKAMAAAPFVLIIQLLFSGILFQLKGAGKLISYFTVSRWSVEALGSIAKLNRLDLKLQKDYPMLEHEAEAFFKAAKGHVVQCWGILLLMTVVCLVVSMISLRRIAKDRR